MAASDRSRSPSPRLLRHISAASLVPTWASPTAYDLYLFPYSVFSSYSFRCHRHCWRLGRIHEHLPGGLDYYVS